MFALPVDDHEGCLMKTIPAVADMHMARGFDEWVPQMIQSYFCELPDPGGVVHENWRFAPRLKLGLCGINDEILAHSLTLKR